MKQAKVEDTSISVNSVLPRLGVSRSGYYKWLKRKPSKQLLRKEAMKKDIQKIYDQSHKIYGSPKITKLLEQKGNKIAQKTVHHYLSELGIKAHYIKPYTRTTINSDYSITLENILNREFNPNKPNAVWCTDITYIHTVDDGFVYLTSIMDLYSRKIIAWTLSETMEVNVVLKCLEWAIADAPRVEALVIQSDRGSHFVSQRYQDLCKDMIRSYSDKGVPYDNACIESFHSLIKREWLTPRRIQNYQEAYRLVFEYIETFYNTVRIHSHCDYVSPNQYMMNYYLSNH